MDLKELLRKRAQLIAQARDINAKADGESRSKTPEERAEFDRLTSEAESLGEEIAQRQRLIALESAAGAVGERQSDPLPHQEERNLGRYSILRAINCLATGRKVDGLEGEVSQEMVSRRGRGIKGSGIGFVMPYDLPIDMRSAAIGRRRYGTLEQRTFNMAAGAGGVPTVLDSTYIDILRNRMVVMTSGARVLTDMQGNFAIPRQSSTTQMYWLAEGGSPSGSQPTVDQVPFTPRTAGAYTDISRRLAEQINTDAEMFVREDLTAVVARGVDKAALNGSGTNNEPLGLLQNPAIGVTAIGANGGAPTWDALVAQETAVAVANADMGSLAYVTNAKVRGKMKTTTKVAASTFPIYLWNSDSPDAPVNGYPALVTNQLPSNLAKGSSGAVCSPIIFGNWNDLIIAFWSGQDVILDPYTGSTSGTLRIVVLQDCDINIRHPESFNNIVDVATT